MLSVFSLLVPDLVGTQQSIIDAAAELGDGVGGIEALVGIDLSGGVGISGDLPATDIDGVQSGFDHFDGLVAGHGAESLDVTLGIHQLPEALGAEAGKGVIDVDGAAQALHVLGGVSTLNAAPACIGLPGMGDIEAVVFGSHCRLPLPSVVAKLRTKRAVCAGDGGAWKGTREIAQGMRHKGPALDALRAVQRIEPL